MNDTDKSPESGKEKIEKPPILGEQKREVTVGTVMRMMGAATQADIELVTAKMSVIEAKFNTLTMKLDRMNGLLQALPVASDVERIDVHIGAIKQLLKEKLGESESQILEGKKETTIVTAAVSQEQPTAEGEGAEEGATATEGA